MPGKFTCPQCGSHEWGSSYNFDGSGDTPMTDDPAKLLPGQKVTTLDTGGRSTRYEGTFTRLCHGRVGNQSCTFRWNSRVDAKYGIEPISGTVRAVKT